RGQVEGPQGVNGGLAEPLAQADLEADEDAALGGVVAGDDSPPRVEPGQRRLLGAAVRDGLAGGGEDRVGGVRAGANCRRRGNERHQGNADGPPQAVPYGPALHTDLLTSEPPGGEWRGERLQER